MRMLGIIMKKLDRLINRIVLNTVSAYGGFCRRKFLHEAEKAEKYEKKMLHGILRRNAGTEFGVKYGFSGIRSAADYQRAVPFTDYSDYRDYIERTAQQGEQNLITRDRISFLANTSGTTGVTKHIPVVARSYAPYQKCIAMFFHLLKKELRARGIRGGKVLNTIETESSFTPAGIRQGFISSFVVGNSKLLVQALTCMPMSVLDYGDTIDMKYIKARAALSERELVGSVSAFMSTVTDLMSYIEENREMLCRDIAEGGVDPSVDLPDGLRADLARFFRPDPARAAEIEKAFEGTRGGLIKRLWPDMTMIIAIGTGEFAPFADKLRSYCGPDVKFCYSMYCASESLFASTVDAEDENYLMLPSAGFFEFIPADREDGEAEPLMLHELETGGYYEVVVTSLSGLYRYRIRDVIVVTGLRGASPLIRFAYRKDQLLNITGVKLTAEHFSNAVAAFERRVGVKVLDYSFYPDLGRSPWRLRMFMELESGMPEGMDKDPASIFDEELAKVNAEHGRMLKIGESSPSALSIVRPGSYERYRERYAKQKLSGNQIKAVRYVDSPEKLEYFDSCTETTYEQQSER